MTAQTSAAHVHPPHPTRVANRVHASDFPISCTVSSRGFGGLVRVRLPPSAAYYPTTYCQRTIHNPPPTCPSPFTIRYPRYHSLCATCYLLFSRRRPTHTNPSLLAMHYPCSPTTHSSGTTTAYLQPTQRSVRAHAPQHHQLHTTYHTCLVLPPTFF